MTTRAVIRTADLTRIARAMQASGVQEWRVEIRPDGTVAVYAGRGAQAKEVVNPWDALADAAP